MNVLTTRPCVYASPQPQPAARPAFLAESPYLSQGVEALWVGRHIWLDNVKDGLGPTVGGVAGAVTAVGALGLGVCRLRSDSLLDKVDGVGLLAASAHSALEAWSVLGAHESPEMLLGPLKVVNGLATAGVGIGDLVRARQNGEPRRYLTGALGIAAGVALAGSGVLPNLAPALHVAAGAAVAGKLLVL
ncbi:MAG: hypothetical protein AB1758_36825, partial [Candidatus Eremiobacterota bacterium]